MSLLSRWGGQARDVLFGARPALAKPGPTFGQAFANVFAFFAGLLAWSARNPIAVLALVVLLAFLLFGAPSCVPFGGKSKGELRLEQRLATAEASLQATINQRDAVLAQISQSVALTRQELRALDARARNEIAAATPLNEAPIDAGLVSAWANSIDRLCLYPNSNGDFPDTCGRRA